MDVLGWLLAGDPAIRWQALRDLTDADPQTVAAARGDVATSGWGAALLAARDPDGVWAGGAVFPAGFWLIPQTERGPGQPWTPTLPTLVLLRDLGLDPDSVLARDAVARVRARCRWEYDRLPFFNGEVEACINGRALAVGSYFRTPVDPIVRTLLAGQLADGGWNCWDEQGARTASFHSTICVLEGLWAWQRWTGGTPAVTQARRRGEEYLLERHLFRRRRTGAVADPHWLEFSFPPYWHYDVLRALDHFRAVGVPDPRLAEAIEIVRARQQPDGRWLLENTHPGAVWLTLEGGDGRPSRWNTLRALRVLRWWDRS